MDRGVPERSRSKAASEPSIRTVKSQSNKPHRYASYPAMGPLSKSPSLEHVPIDPYSHPAVVKPVPIDLYSHPAVVKHVATHPRYVFRTFGDYLLLQTLGEGEFGKVKLGVHLHSGEEVAIKIVRRGDIGSSTRMPGVEQEIQMLCALKHPNIVTLHDVVETKDRIGIVLEYASGGELFDRIIEQEYLDEEEACKLFSQLISGVSYMHKKNIVHRDLKLDNLLLDRSHNVLITDFGFAKKSDHLLQTSCGSPCYAAPELMTVNAYNGPAADVWSCGIILFGMLAGYLPYHDDPDNPEGENIKLLYKYILNSPIPFPDYFSEDIRDLLSMILVPDPNDRAGLEEVMNHRWLAIWAHLFKRSLSEMEQEALKRVEEGKEIYQKRLKSIFDGTDSSKENQEGSSPDCDEKTPDHRSVVSTASTPVEGDPVLSDDVTHALISEHDPSTPTLPKVMDEALSSENAFKTNEAPPASSIHHTRDPPLVAVHDPGHDKVGIEQSDQDHHREGNYILITSSHEEHSHASSKDRRSDSLAFDRISTSHVPEDPVQSSIAATSSVSSSIIPSGSSSAGGQDVPATSSELDKTSGDNPAEPQSKIGRRNTLTLMRQKLLLKNRNRAKSSATSIAVDQKSGKPDSEAKSSFVTVTTAGGMESSSSRTSSSDVKTSSGGLSPAKKVAKRISGWLDYSSNLKLHGPRRDPEDGSAQRQ